MTAVLERVPVEEIGERARQVDVGRSLLAVVAFVFYALGWTVGKATLAVAWCFVAVRLGFVEARSQAGKAGSRGPAG